MIGQRDVTLKSDAPKALLLDLHVKYLKQYGEDDAGTDQIMAEHLKMSGIYWGLNALTLMHKLDTPESQKAADFIKTCQNEDGGFAAAPKHDSHLLHTVCAVQILVILDKCDSDHINADKCVEYVKSLQQEDGSFFGDKWGEVDARFSLCALATLKLLHRLEAIDLDKAADFILACHNEIDGGFGRQPGSESHTAYVYCCLGSLSIADKLNCFDADQLGQWLAERQLPSGGLNGRPEKLPDLCYSWWCVASMRIINKMHLINHEKLIAFILACQDEELGGFSDRPGNWCDPYHTMFGLAGLSLLCHHHSLSNLQNLLKPVNPVLCMPEETIKFRTNVGK